MTDERIVENPADPRTVHIMDLLNDTVNRVHTVVSNLIDAKCRQQGVKCLDPGETMAVMNGIVSTVAIFASRMEFTRNADASTEDKRTPEESMADALRQQFLDVYYAETAHRQAIGESPQPH